MFHISGFLYRVPDLRCFGLFYLMKNGTTQPPEGDFTDEMLKKIGARIRELRKAKGYDSYEKFAFEHDIPRSQLWRYEHGEDSRLSSLIKVMKALNVSFSEFFSEGF